MFGRLGWMEILVIVILVVVLFGSAKIPGMMKNLADGINVFKKEVKTSASDDAARAVPAKKTASKSAATKKKPAVKKASAKKSAKK